MTFGRIPNWDLLQFLYRDLDDQLQQANLETSGSTSPDLDEDDALDEWDQRDFLEFEVRLGLMPGGQYDLAVWDPFSNAGIEDNVKRQLEYFEDRVQPSITSSSSDRRSSTASWEDLSAYQYVKDVVENGSPEEFKGSFVPTTFVEWGSTVMKFTNFNKLLERQYYQESSDASYERHYDNQADLPRGEVVGAHAETLYELLVERPESCVEHEHGALIQLFAFSQRSVNSGAIFNMLLSSCLDTEDRPPSHHWQETKCTYSSELQQRRHDRAGAIDICYHVRTSKCNRLSLHLFFNNSALWVNQVPPDHRQLSLPKPSSISLADLLKRGHFKAEGLNNRIKRYRLALLLASSLHQLYSGPWLQENWSANLVQFLYHPKSKIIESLDRPYIPCTFIRNWKANNTVFKESQQQAETCPNFFLSFAQLLVDIAKGELEIRASAEQYTPNWDQLLTDELELNFQDEVLLWYRKAIQGCLWYSLYYNAEADRIKDIRSRAQAVIHENIVQHLQRNLKIWEEIRDKESHSLNLAGANERCDEPSPYLIPLEAHKSPEAVNSPMNSMISSQIIDPLIHTAEFTLFADGDEIYERREDTDIHKNKFISLLEQHGRCYISSLPKLENCSATGRNIRIAVLDTGLQIDERDNLLCSGETRVTAKKNFIDATRSEDCSDNHGHGTHVARILLRFAPRAQLVIAKVSEGRSLKETKLDQVIEALKWAGENADIINLSFGLGPLSKPLIKPVISDLVKKGKLIFAAASNSGGNGYRAYPANERGVFCIHATDENGDKARGMNPARLNGPEDNFSTLGVKIDSFWGGEDVYISGTSFATPVAAAIAANALEYVRRTLTEKNDKPDFFMGFYGMRLLFRAMVDNIDGYHYVKPWKVGLWDNRSDVKQRLREISIYGEDRRSQMRQEEV